MSVPSVAPGFQLLQVNLISAQDLPPVNKSLRAYAVAWIHPERKLTTRIDEDGHTDPTWNENFVFRVDEQLLHTETASIMIEIYTSAWLRDVLVGTVGVLLSNLLPQANRKSKTGFVALQVRRPSGRPQGLLNVGVSLLDSTMRSMPLYSDLSASATGCWDLMDWRQHKPNATEETELSMISREPVDTKFISLERSQSDRTETTYDVYANEKQGSVSVSVSVCNGYSVFGEAEVGHGVAAQKGGLANANGSLCSDVGPSPSVVAAAIAKGLYPIPIPASEGKESCVLEDWREKRSEGMNTRMERWRAELTPIYDRLEYTERRTKQRRSGQTRNPKAKGNGLFSCFGSAFGCEFSISFGGGKPDSKKAIKPRPSPSELTFDQTSYF